MEQTSQWGLTFFEVGQIYTEMYAHLDVYFLLLRLGICALTYESFLISPQPVYEGNKLQRQNSEFIYLLAHCTKFFKPLKKFQIIIRPTRPPRQTITFACDEK